jgi:hypothetical protein
MIKGENGLWVVKSSGTHLKKILIIFEQKIKGRDSPSFSAINLLAMHPSFQVRYDL